MKFFYALFIGLCELGGYAFVNMLFIPNADPAIGLIFGGVLFVACFIIGLFDYDKKMTKKTEEEKRKAEQDHNNELMRQYLEKKLNEEREKENENEKQK